MKVLTIREPWATAVAIGVKRFETRSWSTTYRGELAIHAGRRWDAEGRGVLASLKAANVLPDKWEPVLGAIVCVARLVDVHEASELEFISHRERQLGCYVRGHRAWKLDSVRPLSIPVICRGRQGIWSAGEALSAEIRAALGE